MRDIERYENGIFTVRFVGDKLSERGVSIYDFANSLMTIQRIVNKAHLSIDRRLTKGAYPSRKDREMISLSIGERKRTSDAFALVPLLTDPTTVTYLKKVADYVLSGIVGYYVGDVLKRVNNEDDVNKQQYIGAIHADVVNIVNRIDGAGGIESIEIGSPALGKPMVAAFNESNKEYINQLSGEYALGKTQTIKGNVYRFYPNSGIVTIRRSGGRKVNVFLNEKDFQEIRYYKGDDPKVSFTGNPRIKFGVESNVITDFEANEIEIDRKA